MTSSFSLAVECILKLDAAELALVQQLIQSITTGTNEVPIRWVPEGTGK